MAPGTPLATGGTGTRSVLDLDMDCKTFRDNHAVFVDLACSALEENEMREHLRGCPNCARHDTVVRRSLMLVRSLPTIDVSPDFQARLDARLRAIAMEPPAAARMWRPSYRTFAALAAGVAFVTYLAAETMRRAGPAELRFEPVVATAPQPEPEQSLVATSALVATVPTGMSVWPAIMVASQAPMHFVAAEMASER
jgi:putative zinc finger protein